MTITSRSDGINTDHRQPYPTARTVAIFVQTQPLPNLSSTSVLVIDRVAGEIIRLVASVCVCVCVSVCLSVGALLFEPFDL